LIFKANSGKEMNYTVKFPSQYLQGQGALHELQDLIDLFGGRGLILCSPSVKEKILPVYGCDILDAQVPVEVFHGECCEKELGRLDHIIEKRNINVIIGMGGGKTIDTAKIAADRRDIPVIIVPTIASTDAPCSGCAVLYSTDGIFIKVLYQKKNPTVVLVDMNVIVNAPSRFLVAGMGDALSTWFEARSCRLTESLNECGGLSTLTGFNLAKLCYDTLMKYGADAKIDCEDRIVSPALNYITEANILLSGVGFESGGLAAAHAIQNGLTCLNETHPFYHGEKVAFGVLAGLHLDSASSEEIETVYSFCEGIGLPTTLADIGVDFKDQPKLIQVAEKTCEEGSPVYHEVVTVTPERILQAMLKADETGRGRKRN
jgi:glycerol dehydrogenase